MSRAGCGAAGYDVSLDPFDFPLFTLNSATLAEVSPTARTFAPDTDYIVAQFAASGNVTANIVPTNDIQIHRRAERAGHQRLRAGRLPGLDGGQHRPDAARHLPVRGRSARTPRRPAPWRR